VGRLPPARPMAMRAAVKAFRSDQGSGGGREGIDIVPEGYGEIYHIVFEAMLNNRKVRIILNESGMSSRKIASNGKPNEAMIAERLGA